MYSWQQFTEDAAIILGGGTEGRKKATELLQNQKVLVIAGSTFIGVVLLYSVRKLYTRSRSNPGSLRKSRLSAHDLHQETQKSKLSDLNKTAEHLENMAENTMAKSSESVTKSGSDIIVPEKIIDTETAPNILEKQGSGDTKSVPKSEANATSASSPNENSPHHTANGTENGEIVGNGHETPAEDVRKRDMVLNEKLLKYYNSYAVIPEDHLGIVQTIIEDFKYMFSDGVEKLIPNHTLHGLESSGSSIVGLQVVKPDGVDIHVSLALDPAHWVLIDAGQSVMSAHGYWLIKRQQVEFFSHGTSKYDKYLISDYLSPNKILSIFLDMINRVAKWSEEYKVKAEVVGPSVTLTVCYQDHQQQKQTVILDFIPSVTLNDVTVVAKAHPMADDDASFANLWRQSFEKEENQQIFAEHPGGNVAAKCVQIIKAIRKSFPFHLGLLNSYVYKNAVLLLLKQEEDWAEEALAERFVDILKTLETSFASHAMSHWYYPQNNLVSHFNPSLLEFMGKSIRDVLHSGQFDGLLQVPAQPAQ